MDQAQDPLPPEISSEARVDRASGRLSTGLCLLLIAVGVIGALVALVSFRVNTLPWHMQWFVDGATGVTLHSSVVDILDAARFQVAAVLVVALNFVLLVLRSGRNGRSTSNTQTSPGAIKDPDAFRDWENSQTTSADTSDDLLNQLNDNSLCADINKELSETVNGVVPAADINFDLTSAHTHHSSQRIANGDVQLQIATSELARVRRELVACRQQLVTSNQTKAQFLANMSHELRTPMNGIMGMTDLLLGGNLSAREERFVNSIASSSSALLAIINDLLDFSKIESGILQLEHGRFSVRDCVEDVCASLAGSAHAKNIELICYVDENVPSQMDGDPGRVRQILNNLVTNAIAFTNEGEVVVRMTRKEERKGKSIYQCDVQDTGVGISPEMQVKLFEAFTQADHSNTRGHGGLGMGLAISRELVSMMNGQISFRSRLGEGTRFSFTMELEDVSDSSTIASRRRSLQGARVLVVDDNETNRTILFHQLSNWGLLVETVSSGKLALESMRAAHDRKQGFDVLILDLHMPGMDGIQLARAIQAESDFRHIQAIMLTSAILQLDGMELRKLGIHKYVSKPARQSVLHDSLASLMPNIATSHSNTVPGNGSDRLSINARVLLVEDNPVNQDVAMGMLEQLGCDVSLATDGQDAVKKGEAEKFDIVLMDCQMPTMDGYEATRRIKSDGSLNAPTPIVALTANAMDGDREKCLLAGMDDYVSKPVRTQILSHMIEKWVGRPQEAFDAKQHSQTPALVASGNRADDVTSTVNKVDLDIGEENIAPDKKDVASRMDSKVEPESAVSAEHSDHAGASLHIVQGNEKRQASTAARSDSGSDSGNDVSGVTIRRESSDASSDADNNAASESTDGAVSNASATVDSRPEIDAGSHTASEKPAGQKFNDASHNEPAQDPTSPVADGTSDTTVDPSDSIINLKAITVIRSLQRPGKDDLLTKVVGVYFDKTPELIQEMSAALEAGDFDAISACAHSLKSSSAYLGADSLSAKCRLIESAVREGNHDQIDDLVAGIGTEYELVSAELNSMLKAA